jgi:hypothetical protein
VTVCDTITHATNLVGLLHISSTARNPTSKQTLPSVDNIAEIAELLTQEDAIIIAQDKISCLDDMSIKGDIPDDVSDIVEVREKALFTGS